jgi:N-acetylglucosamine kinase
MSIVAGIDAGGTSVRVRIGDTETYHDATDSGTPPDFPTDSRVTSACAGITKFTRTGIREAWEAALVARFPNARVTVVPDYVIAFHGGIGEHPAGIAVIAGTGSVVYGEDTSGNTVRVGGRGWEYGDEGSGTHLTTEVIRRTLRTLDGLDIATPLTEAVIAHLGTTEPAALAEVARQQATTVGRGFLVPLVLARAQAGDDEARNLFVGAAGWLAAYAKAACRRLNLTQDVPVVPLGGLWEAGELLSVPFLTVLHRSIPGAILLPHTENALAGAMKLAQA